MKTHHTVILIGNKHQSVKCVRRNDMSLDEDTLIAVGLALALKKKETKRSKWARSWLLKRKKFSHSNLLVDLRLEPNDWRNYLRMDEQAYTHLLTLVTPFIERSDTLMRDSISAHERLTVTLRYLATGRSLNDLKFSAIIAPNTLSLIIPETCDAIYKVLHKDYFKVRKFMSLKNIYFSKKSF